MIPFLHLSLCILLARLAATSVHLHDRYAAEIEGLPPKYHRYVNMKDSGEFIVFGPARRFKREVGAYARTTVVRPPRQPTLEKNDRKRLALRESVRQAEALNKIVFLFSVFCRLLCILY